MLRGPSRLAFTGRGWIELRSESEMSHAGIQADSTGERRGAAVSFATKEEAMAYMVSLAPHGTNLFDIPVVESGGPAASQWTQSTAS
jgi:hypothetical protein